jgi:two-component system sensor histidine kinase KdpD
MFDCPLYILTIDSKPLDELDAEKSDYISRWKELAEKHDQATFIYKGQQDLPVSKVIASVAREKSVTQIILGQTAQSRWEQITKGSIINDLLREIPFVDLHIISVPRYLKNEKGQYNKGVRAYLVKEGEYYRVIFKHTRDVKFEGIFFKEIGTDFNNGVFTFMKDKQTLRVRVANNMIKDLSCFK